MQRRALGGGRLAFGLARIEGHSIEEVARRTGVCEAVVLTHVREASRRLNAMLKEENARSERAPPPPAAAPQPSREVPLISPRARMIWSLDMRPVDPSTGAGNGAD